MENVQLYDAPEPTDEELTAGMTPLEVFSGPPITVLRQQWRDAHRLPSLDPAPAPAPVEAGPAVPDRPAAVVPQPSRRWFRLPSLVIRSRPAASEAVREPAVQKPAPTTPVAPVRAGTDAVVRPTPARSRWEIAAVAVLAVLVLAIVAVGLRTGLGALKDAALAAHIAPAAAGTYWIGVDGLIVLAIIAALILRNNRAAVRYCLVIIVAFTTASGLLQFLHGLGWFAGGKPSHPPVGTQALPWGVVLVIALLVIGTTAFGTHLLVHVLRHLFPAVGTGPATDLLQQAEAVAIDADPAAPEDGSDETADRPDEAVPPVPPAAPEPPPAPEPDPEHVAALVYAACLDAGVRLSRRKLAELARISERRASHVRADVDADREEAAESAESEAVTPEIRERLTRMREEAIMAPGTLLTVNGSALNSRTNPDRGEA